MEKADCDQVIADCSRIIQLNPNDANAYYKRGLAFWDLYICHKGKNKLEEAIDKLEKAIELNPSDAFVYKERGNVYRMKGDFKKAVVDYENAIKLKPSMGLGIIFRGKMT